MWRQHALPPLRQEWNKRSSVFFFPTPRYALSHSHQVPAQWGESHAMYAFSLTPLDILVTLFCTCTEWLANPYVLIIPGPSKGNLYLTKIMKKIRKWRDVQAKENALEKSGKLTPSTGPPKEKKLDKRARFR